MMQRFLTLRRFAIALSCLLGAVMATPALGQTLSAEVDRTRIGQAESVNLTLSIDQQADVNRIDLSPLDQDWQILSRSSQSSVQMVNGRTTATSSLRLTLLPRSTGTVVIPSFNFDGSISDAIPVEVVEQSAGTGADLPLAVELDVGRNRARVGEGVPVTVRLQAAADVGNISGEELEVAGADVLLVDRSDFSRVVDGQTQRVFEWRYRIFPQQPGELAIPSQLFTGSSGGTYDPFFNPRGTQPRRVAARSDESRLPVDPPATDAAHPTWLPAEKVTLSARWEGDPGEIHVGEPITRTVIVRASGQRGAAIPDLAEPQGNFKQYPDQPVYEDLVDNGELIGSRRQSVAIVATQPGDLVLPELRLPWWNTQTEQWEEAILPETYLRVLPAADVGINTALPADEQATGIAAGATGSSGSWINHPAWFWSTLVLAFATLLLLWRGRGSALAPIPVGRPARRAAPDPLPAIRSGDASRARRALIDWAAAHYGTPVTALADIRRHASSSEFTDVLQALDNHLYGHGVPPDWERLAAQFQAEQSTTNPAQKSDHSALPPLYPDRSN